MHFFDKGFAPPQKYKFIYFDILIHLSVADAVLLEWSGNLQCQRSMQGYMESKLDNNKYGLDRGSIAQGQLQFRCHYLPHTIVQFGFVISSFILPQSGRVPLLVSQQYCESSCI